MKKDSSYWAKTQSRLNNIVYQLNEIKNDGESFNLRSTKAINMDLFLALSFKEQIRTVEKILINLMKNMNKIGLITNEDKSNLTGFFRSTTKIIMRSIVEMHHQYGIPIICDSYNRPRVKHNMLNYCVEKEMGSTLLTDTIYSLHAEISRVVCTNNKTEEVIFVVNKHIPNEEFMFLLAAVSTAISCKKKIIFIITTEEKENDKTMKKSIEFSLNRFKFMENEIFDLMGLFRLNYEFSKKINPDLEEMSISKGKYRFLMTSMDDLLNIISDCVSEMRGLNEDLSAISRENRVVKQEVRDLDSLLKRSEVDLNHVTEDLYKKEKENEMLLKENYSLRQKIKENEREIRKLSLIINEKISSDRQIIESRSSEENAGYYKPLPTYEYRRERERGRFLNHYFDVTIVEDEHKQEDVDEFIKRHIELI